MLELGATDLGWSDEEARVLLDRLGARVDPEVVDELNGRVSGWCGDSCSSVACSRGAATSAAA